MNRHRDRGPAQPWSRGRLLGAAAVLAVSVAALLGALVLAVVQGLAGTPTGPVPRPQFAAPDVRDRIAAEPMAQVPREAAAQGVPALNPPDPIRVPEPAVLRGPAGVPSGFPHTPAGAVGQLAAIEVAVVEAMDLEVTREVHQAWVQQGGPSYDAWVLTRSVQAFLGSSGQTGTAKSAGTMVRATPAGGLVKGIDGPDWVVACVLLDVHAVVRTEARVGFGHCERMAWAGDRWVIAPGTPPAMAPSAWPGSQTAADAGWLPWATADPQEVRR